MFVTSGNFDIDLVRCKTQFDLITDSIKELPERNDFISASIIFYQL